MPVQKVERESGRTPLLADCVGDHKVKLVRLREKLSDKPAKRGLRVACCDVEILASPTATVGATYTLLCLEAHGYEQIYTDWCREIMAALTGARRAADVPIEQWRGAIDKGWQEKLIGRVFGVTVSPNVAKPQFPCVDVGAWADPPSGSLSPTPVAAPEREPGADDDCPF
jgi:hypothetical protein